MPLQPQDAGHALYIVHHVYVSMGKSIPIIDTMGNALCICMYVCIYACICVCMHVYVCMYMYIYVHYYACDVWSLVRTCKE